MGVDLADRKGPEGPLRRPLLRSLFRQHGQERPLPRVRLAVVITARRQLLTAAALVGAALATWIVTVQRMRGMDAGPGTDLGGLGFFLGVWVTMMAAMMLPSAAPFVLFHARVARQRSTGIFVMGYLAAGTGDRLAGYGGHPGIPPVDPGVPSR